MGIPIGVTIVTPISMRIYLDGGAQTQRALGNIGKERLVGRVTISWHFSLK